jgi:hypothetical protein
MSVDRQRTHVSRYESLKNQYSRGIEVKVELRTLKGPGVIVNLGR